MALQAKRDDLVGSQVLDPHDLGLHAARCRVLGDLNELRADADLQAARCEVR